MSDKLLKDINQAAAQIKDGKIGVLPTDTVYGVVCLAADPAAVSRLYSLKKRHDKPGTLVAASQQQLVDLGIKARYLKAVQGYWPNPISIIIPTGIDLPHLTQGKGSIAVRIPSDPGFNELLKQTGPLLTSSANQPGQPPAATAQEAINCFGDEVDFYVDGGNLGDRPPSTIIRMLDDAVEVVRQGAVTIDEATGKIEQEEIK